VEESAKAQEEATKAKENEAGKLQDDQEGQ
jgi:hypothetical protein